MKFTKIILVSLFLLILTLGVVSASDAIQDNVTSTQDGDVLADDDELDFVEYQVGKGTQNSNLVVNWPSEIKVGETYPVMFDMPEDMDTNVTLYINNERVDDGQEATNGTFYDVFIDEFGTYNLKFKFYGDAKYAPVTKEKSYKVTDYLFNVELQDENLTYGHDTSLIISFPYDLTGTITVGGVKYVVDEDDFINASLRNLQMGTNQIPISYSGDEKYFARNFKYNVNVKAEVIYSLQMPFNNVAFSLTLPANAVGDLEIIVDGYYMKTARLVNGKAEVKFDDLDLGIHSFSARYTGNDYACTSIDWMPFEVTPDIIVDSFKTTKDENSITIRLPEDEMGFLEVKASRFLDSLGGMAVKEISKSAYVVDGSVISFSTLDYGEYKYDIKYTSLLYVFTKTAEGYVRDEFAMNVTAPDKVLADDANIEIRVDHLSTNGGTIELYVDGSEYDELDCTEAGYLIFNYEECLSLGNHRVTLKFTGNDRYMPLEKSLIIQSTNFFFDIPEEIVVGSDDVISINTVKDATGNLVVYVDGEVFATEPVKNGVATVDMSSLSFEDHSVKVLYDVNPAASQTTNLNVSYTFNMAEDEVDYAGSDLYVINLPADLSKDDLVVTVDNITYQVVDLGKDVGINLSKLGVGDHVISVSHPGEGKFYPLSVNKTIDIAGKINIPSEIKLGDDKSISLVLPQNPQGRIVLSKYDEVSKSYVEVSSFGFTSSGSNAIAEIPLTYLGIGDNRIKISYSGADYNVSNAFAQININLDVVYAKQIQYGKKSTVTITLPGAKGAIDVYIDEEFVKTAQFVNGVAKVEFSGLDAGMHLFTLDYSADYSFNYEGQVIVYPKVTVPTTVIDGDKFLVANSGSEPVGSIIFYENGKKLKEVDIEEDGQKISLAFVEKGKHKLTLVYDTWDDATYTIGTYTVNVKKASITAKDKAMAYLDGSKYKVQVKDYKGKVVKKGQTVKFYVDGKLFKTVKTDAKGYASAVFTQTPGKHTIKVVYKATTLTKKLTVKQIVTVKKVNVKKSAKKLDLTATLKKVNGKYLKDKQITFKFNGVTYKAKTNSKGVAKVTVPSKILKKLKVGKNVTYQATYVKATVKQTVKVSK